MGIPVSIDADSAAKAAEKARAVLEPAAMRIMDRIDQTLDRAEKILDRNGFSQLAAALVPHLLVEETKPKDGNTQ